MTLFYFEVETEGRIQEGYIEAKDEQAGKALLSRLLNIDTKDIQMDVFRLSDDEEE